MPARLAALVLLACGALALAVAAAVAARRRRRRAVLPRAVERLLAEVATPLGDGALALDAEGRVVWANEQAARLAGRALLGSDREALGEDLAMLLRGLALGPAAGRVALPAAGAAAQAAAVRLPGAPALDVVLLRLEPPDASVAVLDADIVPEAAPTPPPLRVGPAATATRAQPSLAAVAAELAAPASRARAAAALLRLALPPAAGEPHLGRLEHELEAVEAALASLREPVPAAVPRPVDVAALLSEALRAASFAPGVRMRRVGGAAAALADAGQLRQAIGHVLALASAAMPSGGELGLRTVQRGPEVLLEIAETGAGDPPGLALALAERLVTAQGGRLERACVAGRGGVWRLVLPAAGQAARGASGFDSAGTPR
ncbi:hypothetical protein [Anaeromyxobacter diazotrophicus]|uniref:PAS domain-containing protein n=1 Tax=Anaeromyxobacter diazotrophicus TaxID=2590199 RepID=A0A7I9VM36_9BACT|nr:hypothetical protein [Anaeromyxobacter diazotrophicus]GEJ57465.1 hypothetical protein AMYX_22060 [Anaeromyxobacter diazotrophicus]